MFSYFTDRSSSTRMLLIFYTVFLELIIRESLAFQLPEEPRIYPERSDVTVDAHTDLVLGCRGVEPMRWIFRDDYNDMFYNFSGIIINSTINEKEVTFKHESILTVYNVLPVNIGFYYCHAVAADHNTARRSKRIYVFVRDENYLSVSEYNYFVDINWGGHLPCRPTSPDVSITLECSSLSTEILTLRVNPHNYTGARRSEVSFHPYYGFQLQIASLLDYIHDCECVFTRNNKVMTTLNFQRTDWSSVMTIEGPNTANVGDDITLQCAVLTNLYFPYYWNGFEWKIPNKRNTVIAVHQPLKLKSYVRLSATITIKNISTENEGDYTFYFNKYKESKYVFINDKKTNNYSVPSIYPSNGGEIEVISRGNITLFCSGSRAVTWRAKDEKRPLYIYNQLNITSGKYEAHLHISALRYTDTGFYYCHENDSRSDHPFKSHKIYIFVKDENNLYLPYNYWFLHAYPYTNVTVPCLPTSQDINVSLSLIYAARDPVTKSLGPEQMIDSETYLYDRREGFTFQAPGPGRLYATCTFITETLTATHKITFCVKAPQIHRVVGYPVITGPSEDLVFVGQTLELSCAVLVLPNVPDDALRWTSPSNASVNEIIRKVKGMNFREVKLLISTLILDNAKISDKGRYSCHLDNATANKFISVYDKFDFEPTITTLRYNVVYVGQPFAVQCNVSVDHNVDLPVLSWTTPNVAQVRAKIIDTEYITSVRNIHGRRLLQIDRVGYDDAGNYTCSVSAFTNRRKHVTTNIVVKGGVKPTIVSNFGKEVDMNVLVEGTVELICDAVGDPEPVITWMKGPNEISSSEHIAITSNNTQLTVHFVQEIDAERYTCIAQNPFGEDSHAVNLSVTSVVINGEAFLIVMIILIAIAAGFLTQNLYEAKKRHNALIKGNFIHFKAGQIQYLNPFLNVVDQATLLPYDTKWEIPRNKVELGRNLGSGSFGLVVEATVSNFFEGEPEKTVAVKMLHPYSNFKDLNILISELKIMTHLGKHDNLINLLGACTENIGEKMLLIVLEYCRHGNLRNYLMVNRCNFVNLIDPDTELICFPDANYNSYLRVDDAAQCSSSEVAPVQPPRVCTLQLLNWALQAARGMEYLAAKQILHGDLAARNILLAENFIVKISDFGLSKTLSSECYKKITECPLPIKWMAIESIRDKSFSTQSDVWAFGVVLWELFSLARIPYAELEPDLGFYRKLQSGYRLERPEYSTRELYQVMRECWYEQPQSRPTFASLTHTLTDLLQDPRTVHVDAADDSTNPECSSSAASVLAAKPVDCVALDIDVLTTIDIL